jgi:hypothetical protein
MRSERIESRSRKSSGREQEVVPIQLLAADHSRTNPLAVRLTSTQTDYLASRETENHSCCIPYVRYNRLDYKSNLSSSRRIPPKRTTTMNRKSFRREHHLEMWDVTADTVLGSRRS